MFVLSPRVAYAVLGFFVCLACLDSVFRFSFLPATLSVCNSGIGLGFRLPANVLWLAIVAILMPALFQSLKRPLSSDNLAWGLVFVGGVTNAIDRYAHGCVADYFHVLFFPSFNLADIMIFLGVVALGLSFLGILPKPKPYVC